MTVTVNFENPQVQLGNGTTGIEISPIIIPYSIRDAENQLQYLGGQVVLTKEDNVAFSDNTADWYKKALVKIKDMVASSEIYTPDIAPVAQAAAAPDVTQPTQETANTDVVTTAQVQQ